MKPSERLLKMIRQQLPELDIPEGARLERAAGSYAGWNRTSLGAWVWTAVDANGVPLHRNSEGQPLAIGSQWTMTELVRAGSLAANPSGANPGDIHIEPTDEKQREGVAQ
jgi:hypothetical protein